MTKHQQVDQKMRELIPELTELSFGCRVKDGSGIDVIVQTTDDNKRYKLLGWHDWISTQPTTEDSRPIPSSSSLHPAPKQGVYLL